MPRQHRWVIKRNLEQAINNIDHAINNVVTAGHEFEGIHSEHYQAFCMIATNLEKIAQSITEFKDII